MYLCDTCPRQFYYEDDAETHMDNANHWGPRFPCETCSQVFFTERAADVHMTQTGHYENYCQECNRVFRNENALRMHLNSRIHRGNNVLCPFCRAAFVTPSGACHHLESGSCAKAPPRLNRETIYRMIRQADTNGVITNKQIGWHDEPQMQYEATDRAWNGYYWECYLCHRKFNKRKSLNQHLNSQAHKQKVYHCPNARGGCRKQFTSLAGLCGHLESESCGFMRFEKVQELHKQLDDVIMGKKTLTFF